jgi:hypothetical protein
MKIIEIIENYKDSKFQRVNGTIIELDIYLPEEKLAFEYQGQHHFYDIHYLGSKWSQQQRDNEKKQRCIENGITLIEIFHIGGIFKKKV